MQITSRYEALGMPLPDPKTMCKGHCEGTGWVPYKKRGIGDLDVIPQEDDAIFDKLWEEAHKEAHTAWHKLKVLWDWIRTGHFSWRTKIEYLFEKCDGWHFVKCPDCKGTGKV